MTFIGLQRLLKRALPFEQVPETLHLAPSVRFLPWAAPCCRIRPRACGIFQLDNGSGLLGCSGEQSPSTLFVVDAPTESNSIEGFSGQEGPACAGNEAAVFVPNSAKIKEALIYAWAPTARFAVVQLVDFKYFLTRSALESRFA